MRWMVCLSVFWLGIPLVAQAQVLALPSTPAGFKSAKPLSETETLKNELKETKDRLQAFETENEALRRRNESNTLAKRALDESLAVANAESEFFRREYGELKLRMEALGMESVGDNKEALEQRLLKAVRDLALTQQSKEELSERLVALSEAVMLFIKSASGADAQLRMDVEGQLRAATGALDVTAKGANAEAPPDLMNAKVISVKDEYALIVANIGARQGVKAGMPFRVVRGDRGVARVRVITVRDRICGAVVEEYASTVEIVKVGDQLRVDAQQ